MFHNKPCYCCVSAISFNDNARNCKSGKECKVCNKRHPTFLHGYKAEKSKITQPDDNSSEELKVNPNCATANTKFDVIIMCVIPALVPHKLSNCIANTYAMLVSCSQATFM